MNQVSREKDQAFDRAAGPSIGALLRASRERCGEDLGEVADLLCIRYPYLVAIEEGRFGDLPGKTYATGFVRAYAEHLGLDAEEVVRRFKDESTGIEGGADLHFPSPVPESTFPTGAVLVIGLVVAGLAYGGWQLNSARDGAVADLIAPLPDRLMALLPGGTDGAEPLPPPTPMPPDVTETRPAAPPAPATTPAPETTAAAVTPPAPLQDPASTAAAASVAERAPTPAPAAPAAETVMPDPAPRIADATGTPVAVLSPAAAETAAMAPPPAPRITPADTLAPAARAVPADEEETPPPPPDTDSTSAAGSATDADTGTEVASVPPPPENLSPGIATQAAPPPLAPEAMAPPAPPPSEESAAQQYGGGKFRILVRARSDSWIQVRDETGNELIVTRLLRAGDSYRVPDRGDLTLQTGNAGALEILVDGEIVPSIGPEGAVRRRVALSAQRLLDGTAVVE